MAKDSPEDPSQAFRDMISQWESSVDSLSRQLTGNKEYGRFMAQFQDAQLQATRSFKDFMKQNLESASMPSREDVLRIAESVQDLGKRLERIEKLLQAGGGHAAAAAGTPAAAARKSPPRTRKPPAAQPKAAKKQGTKK